MKVFLLFSTNNIQLDEIADVSSKAAKENLPIGKPLGEDRGLVALMGIRIFINSDPKKKNCSTH